jgi:hypothetical protein
MPIEWSGQIDAAFVTETGDEQNQTVNVLVVLTAVIIAWLFVFVVLPPVKAQTAT